MTGIINIEKQLLFFKTASNLYLAIDRETVQGKNIIYYKGTAIEDSLYNFPEHFDFNRYFLNQLIDTVDYKRERNLKKHEKSQKQEKEIKEEKTNTVTPKPQSQDKIQRKWSTLLDDDDNKV